MNADFRATYIVCWLNRYIALKNEVERIKIKNAQLETRWEPRKPERDSAMLTERMGRVKMNAEGGIRKSEIRNKWKWEFGSRTRRRSVEQGDVAASMRKAEKFRETPAHWPIVHCR